MTLSPLPASPSAGVLEPGIERPGSGPSLVDAAGVLAVILLLLAVAAVGVVLAVRRARARTARP